MEVVAWLIVLVPTGGFTFFLVKIRSKSQRLVHVSRVSTAQAEARQFAAEEAAGVARSTADIAMGQTSQALQIAATMETVDQRVAELSDYLVAKIEGSGQAQPPAVGRGRHSRPELPAPGAIPLPERFTP